MYLKFILIKLLFSKYYMNKYGAASSITFNMSHPITNTGHPNINFP